MATSGTYTFDPQIAEVMDEAFEMAGIDPSAVGSSHIQSALRSLRQMLNSEWATIGIREWTVTRQTQAVTTGMSTFTLPQGAIDVLGMVLRRNGRDTEMYRISRDEYLKIVDKNINGRPDRFFVDRQSGLSAKTVYIWQRGSNNSDVIVYDYMRQIQDPGSMTNEAQVPSYAVHAMTLGLAFRLALKFSPDRAAGLAILYRGQDPNRIGGALDMLRQEDRERSDIEANMLSADYLTRVR